VFERGDRIAGYRPTVSIFFEFLMRLAMALSSLRCRRRPLFPSLSSGAPINFVQVVMHAIDLSEQAEPACFALPRACVLLASETRTTTGILERKRRSTASLPRVSKASSLLEVLEIALRLNDGRIDGRQRTLGIVFRNSAH
jgi:hypothetical protein